MISEKIIDSHLHIEDWKSSEYDSFIDCFEGHRERAGLKAINLCAISTPFRSACQNIMMALYKIKHENTYAHATFDYFDRPLTEEMPEGYDLVTQYKELMEIGFDGIKILEGKPNYLLPIGNNLNHPKLNKVYSEMEKDQTSIIFHVNDPDHFWKRECLPQDLIDKGWCYADAGYLPYEEIQRQAIKVLEDHPSIKITFAHFFFCSQTPEILIDLFAKYPNLCVDLTPGTEMYHAFHANREYYKKFFEKYSDRLLVGTDATFPWETKAHVWCIETLYRFIATTETHMAFNDKELTGLGLEGEAKENILYKNFERRAGTAPKKINLDALRKYVEKYKPFLSSDEWEHIKPFCDEYLG